MIINISFTYLRYLERSVPKGREAFCMFWVWEYIDGPPKILSDLRSGSGSGFPVSKF